MKLVMSPAKTFRKAAISCAPEVLPFPDKTAFLVQKLKALAPEAIEKRFHLSAALAQTVWNYYDGFGSTTFKAGDLYLGEAFKALDYPSLNTKAKRYSHGHLLIFSALYGLIRPDQTISPYRLDLNIPMQDLIGSSLLGYWQYTLRDRLKDETILDLSSQEFSQLLEPGQCLRLDFQICTKGHLASQSMVSKRMRGLYARSLCEEPLQSRKQLKQRSLEGFQYSELLSSAHKYIYIKGELSNDYTK